MSTEIRMPRSMVKAFLVSTGLRAAPGAIDKFEVALKTAGIDLANKIADVTKAKNRKTIQSEDFD